MGNPEELDHAAQEAHERQTKVGPSEAEQSAARDEAEALQILSAEQPADPVTTTETEKPVDAEKFGKELRAFLRDALVSHGRLAEILRAQSYVNNEAEENLSDKAYGFNSSVPGWTRDMARTIIIDRLEDVGLTAEGLPESVDTYYDAQRFRDAIQKKLDTDIREKGIDAVHTWLLSQNRGQSMDAMTAQETILARVGQISKFEKQEAGFNYIPGMYDRVKDRVMLAKEKSILETYQEMLAAGKTDEIEAVVQKESVFKEEELRKAQEWRDKESERERQRQEEQRTNEEQKQQERIRSFRSPDTTDLTAAQQEESRLMAKLVEQQESLAVLRTQLQEKTVEVQEVQAQYQEESTRKRDDWNKRKSESYPDRENFISYIRGVGVLNTDGFTMAERRIDRKFDQEWEETARELRRSYDQTVEAGKDLVAMKESVEKAAAQVAETEHAMKTIKVNILGMEKGRAEEEEAAVVGLELLKEYDNLYPEYDRHSSEAMRQGPYADLAGEAIGNFRAEQRKFRDTIASASLSNRTKVDSLTAMLDKMRKDIVSDRTELKRAA